MARRIFRTAIQLGALALVAFFFVVILDNSFSVLPESIHDRLPAHHPGLIITDVTVTTCSTINFFSSCKLDEDEWHRIEKDLYLGNGWMSSAYVHIRRKTEADLQATDKIVTDIKISRLDPVTTESGKEKEAWEARPAGIWLKRSAKHRTSDSNEAVTSVDVLFGADAVDPRPNWAVKDTPLLLDNVQDNLEPRLSVRKGPAPKVEKPVPRIRKDGKFKIMQAADLHLSTGLGKCRDAMPATSAPCDADPRTMEFVERLLAEEKPDLIILSGDQVNGDTSPDAQSAIYKFASLFAKHQIPYAAIFGNHDDEGDLDRAESMQMMHGLPYSLSEAGPEELDGVGNYYIEVLARGSSPHSALTLYLLDTHAYSPDERQFRGYDWLKPNQIKWFRDTAQGLKHAHSQYTHQHMDLAFIHIPLPEYRNSDNYFKGNWSENPTAPGFNSGFKDALVEEGVVMVSCGHDHVNEYCMLENNAESKPALWMCYGGGAGFGGYGGYYGYHRRIRFFELDMNEARIHTYKRMEWGDTESRIDEQIIVDGGKAIAPNAV